MAKAAKKIRFTPVSMNSIKLEKEGKNAEQMYEDLFKSIRNLAFRRPIKAQA